MGLVFIQPDIGTTIVLVAILVGDPGRRRNPAPAPGRAGAHRFRAALRRVPAQRDQGLSARSAAGVPRQPAATRRAPTTTATRPRSRSASGGLFGQGYLNGTLTNLDFVPEQHTDFIFTVAGEEFGFAGAAFVLALFAILMWRAIRISYLSKDAFGTYVAAGIAVDVRDPDVRQRRDGDRDHADHGDPAAVRELRGKLDARELHRRRDCC